MGAATETFREIHAEEGVRDIEKLRLMLVKNYYSAIFSYNRLPNDEARKAFIKCFTGDHFSDFTEDDFVMGDVRVDMFLNEIECEDMAEERLTAFMALIEHYPVEDNNAAEYDADAADADPAAYFAA